MKQGEKKIQLWESKIFWKCILAIIAILIITSCSKDEEVIQQQFDCECTEVWARDASANRFFPQDIRTCEFPEDIFSNWSVEDNRIITRDFSYSKLEQISFDQGCKN